MSIEELEIITPSYLPDFELCRDLNQSVLKFTSPETHHKIIVPPRDFALFQELENERTSIHDVRDLIPSHLVKFPLANVWVNKRRLWPPARGWIVQQIVKLAAASTSTAKGVLLVDSDMVFVRGIGLDTFSRDGVQEYYANPGAIHEGLPRHRFWYEKASELLGFPPPPASNLTDFVSWPCLWEPRYIAEMLELIEIHNNACWQNVVSRQIHFSEMMLYGVFMSTVHPEVPSTNQMKCLAYSEETSLNEASLNELMHGLREKDVAIMLSARAGIDIQARRRVLSHLSLRLDERSSKNNEL